MSNWSITILTPNGRRHVQRCTANTTLLQILEQTCQKYDFKAEEYELTHHNRVVDSTATIRFSGLPNNAFLEMAQAKQTRVESEVTLGLQLENGSRLMGTYKPSTTLYEVLQVLIPDQCSLESNPVVIYMRKEVYGNDLLNTTLKSLGLTSGRAIVRLIHRTPEQLKTQANISAPLPQKAKEDKINDEFEYCHDKNESKLSIPENTNITHVSNASIIDENKMDVNIISTKLDKTEQNTRAADLNIPNEKDFSMEVCEAETKVDDEIEYDKNIFIVGERNAIVFSQEMSNNISLDDLPDDFFDLSVEEVKKLYLELGKRCQELQNAPFKTEALRSVETITKTKNKIQKNPNVVLRILFPDRTVLQANFLPLDKIETVKNFITTYLKDPHMSFDLYVTPPKQILLTELTLLDAKCVPSAVLHFGPHNIDLPSLSSCQYLTDYILSQISSPMAAQLSALKTRGINTNKRAATATPKKDQINLSITDNEKIQEVNNPSSSESSSKENVKLPKWFKINK